MSEQPHGVIDETVDDEYKESDAHGCADVEECEPTSPKPATYPLQPVVESYRFQHQVVGLGYDSVLVGLQELCETIDDEPNGEIEE